MMPRRSLISLWNWSIGRSRAFWLIWLVAMRNEPKGSTPKSGRPTPRRVRSASYQISSLLFLRFLGIIYLIAFVSLWVQIDGLVGSQGISPAVSFLEAVDKQLGADAYWRVPTFFWLGCSDFALHLVCGIGTFFSAVLVFGLLPPFTCLLLWGLYLSLVSITGVFLGFQWDNLLLEVGFLAIFLGPMRIWPRVGRHWKPSPIILFLLVWLLFRLIFSSGVVKMQDEPFSPNTWKALTALTYHYETQPLANTVAWFMHQLPEWFQKFSVVVTFICQLGIPWLVFGPPVMKKIAFCGILFLQLLIVATGNYCFFNLLALSLCLLLLDDKLLLACSPRRYIRRVAHGRRRKVAWIRNIVIIPVAIVVGATSLTIMVDLLTGRAYQIQRKFPVTKYISPFRSINGYGLFARMTTERPEILVEGSNDRQTWIAYEFKWKPGDLSQRPLQVAPHQPRLDWQMWFAALGSMDRNPWFLNFLHRLLEGTPEVLALLKTNPFPDSPPKYIRAVMYDYHFTNFEERNDTGDWWKRDKQRMYCRPISLESFRKR